MKRLLRNVGKQGNAGKDGQIYQTFIGLAGRRLLLAG
jgi:hypothetical protein